MGGILDLPGSPKWKFRVLVDGYDIRTVPESLGHRDARATTIRTHVLNRGGQGVVSTLDRLRRAPLRESRKGWRIMPTERLDKKFRG